MKEGIERGRKGRERGKSGRTRRRKGREDKPFYHGYVMVLSLVFVHKHSKALETLHNTQQEVDTMKNTLSELKKCHEEASKLSATLLSNLTSKSCQLERLKALLGHGSSVLSAMQVVGEQQRLLAENEEDDEELLAVFVDRQSSRLELLLHRAREQLVVAEREERETKLAMNKTKEEV